MTAGDVLPPEAVEATDAAGAALIEAIVARRRAELARLSLAARTARQRCDRAEAELAGVADVESDGVPADLLGVVDAMLEKAIGASELALASAEREASFILDRAMADGAEVLRRAGSDPTLVLTGRPTAPTPRSVGAPPTAAELWRTTRRASMPRPSAPSAGGPAPTTSDREIPGAAPTRTAALPTTPPAPSASVPAPFVPVVVPDRGGVEPGEAFDTFWQEVPGERRVRDRLLRRSPKESA